MEERFRQRSRQAAAPEAHRANEPAQKGKRWKKKIGAVARLFLTRSGREAREDVPFAATRPGPGSDGRQRLEAPAWGRHHETVI